MKKSVRHFGGELASIIRNRKVLIPVIAVLLIPLLYSFMFLWAFWDPYAKMDLLPVAVVNQDKGAVFEGKQLSVGNEFADKLKESKSFDWKFVSKEDADYGLKNHKYYIAIEIPEDFSERATKVLDPNPAPAAFRFIPNESSNFLASQIGKSAVERMKSELSAQLTKTYTQTVFENITKLADGLVQAADGAQKLSDGTKNVEEGATLIDENLVKLADGTQPLKTGVRQLADGSAKLNTGVLKLQQGADQLAAGMSGLRDGQSRLEQGGKQAEEGLGKLTDGLSGSVTGLEQLKQGSANVAGGLQQYAAAHPELAKDPQFMKLVEGSKQVSGGTDSVLNGQKQLQEGARRLTEGQKQANSGQAVFGEKLAQAQQGAQGLSAGGKQLVPGSLQLKNGLSQLAGGVDRLSDSTAQLNEGAKKLADGAVTVANGTGELSGKLHDASVQTSGIKGSDKLYQAFAQPVTFEEEKVAAVPNYGTGFAPYFLSLGLMVGALLLSIVFPIMEPAVAPRSAFSWFFGKTMIMGLVGLLQAVIMDAVMLWGLGIEVRSVPLFFVMSVFTSWTFMAMIQFLVTLFGDPGRFIAIVLLIAQLTSCAGTFPVELIPDPLKNVSAWMPMTYSVQAFKAVISSGDFGYMWRNAGILLGYIAAMGVITLVYFIVHFRKRHVRDSSTAATA